MTVDSMEETARLVTETWRAATPDDAAIDAVGVAFFKRIFEIAPGALEMFSFKDEPAEGLYASEKFLTHARKVIRTVGVAVDGLGNLDALVPVLKGLGARHVGYGVAAAHYDVVGQALLDTLAMGLGDAFTDEVRAAWVAVYGVVSSTMQAGAEAFVTKNLKE